MDKIAEDLKVRELKIAAIICENKEGLLQVLSYDNNDLVQFISETAKDITINKRLGGNMVRPIAEIGKRPQQTIK